MRSIWSGKMSNGAKLVCWRLRVASYLFFFNDTATTEIYTLPLHDALPIWPSRPPSGARRPSETRRRPAGRGDRKSTRLNSSHDQISYAVFCLKKELDVILSRRPAHARAHVVRPHHLRQRA